METKYELALNVLKEFQKEGILDKIVLIGSWCIFFYRQYFDNTDDIHLWKTADIDFLIPDPRKIPGEYNIPDILKKFDFIEKPASSGQSQFVHPDLYLEFLLVKKGKGTDEPVKYIPKFHLKAVELRYLNLLESNIMTLNYRGIKIRLPEPSSFVFHKIILSDKRKNSLKRDKDFDSAIQIANVLLKNKSEKEKLIDTYNSFPKGWQKTINKILIKNNIDIAEWLG